MVAIDTNIVVRYIVRDEAAQHERAVAIVDGEGVSVCPTVLLESAWVLGEGYELTKDEVLNALRGFCGLPTVKVAQASAVARAFAFVEGGLGFADALHLSQTDDAETFATFDKDLVKKARRLGVAAVRLA